MINFGRPVSKTGDSRHALVETRIELQIYGRCDLQIGNQVYMPTLPQPAGDSRILRKSAAEHPKQFALV